MQLLHPRKVALEVFGALVLLKLSASGLRWFQHDKQHEVWFAPAARIRLWSGTIAAYYLVKSIKSPKLSAWRNGAIALFATDALKPVLQGPKRRGKPAPPRPSTAPVLTAPAASEPAAPQPAPPSTAPTPEAQPPQPTEAPGAH